MTTGSILYASFSFPGRKRFNQDELLAEHLSNGAYIFAIADGMGGTSGGDIASRIAIQTLHESLSANPEMPMVQLFQQIHYDLKERADAHPDLHRMGTTLTVCMVSGSRVNVGHVGDSRLYQLRNQGLKTITKDQSEVQKLIDEGVLTYKQALKYHRKNVLLSVLSPSYIYDLASFSFEVQKNDRLLLVTDGVHGILSKDEIKDISVNSNQVEQFCANLKEAVETKGPTDDYSAVCCQIMQA